MSTLDPTEVGICYATHINQMIKIQQETKKLGLASICIWSTRNQNHPMTEEQLAVRHTILEYCQIPDQYHLLIINASSETSIKIKSSVDYVIVNNNNRDTQIQVRGRVNSDLAQLYIYDSKQQEIIVPNEFLSKKNF